ncbi:hypothetical protein glysoja_036940, partial [Glycine soja]
WLTNQNIPNVITESDCKHIVYHIKSKEEDITSCGFILNQIRDILRSYPSYSIEYVRRQANLVAHSLARNSFLLEQHCIFLNTPLLVLLIL